MKRLIVVIAMLLIFTGVSHAVNVEVCTLTFTNVTTTGVTATSATASGNNKCTANSANGYAIDTHGARSVHTDWMPNAVTHTATDWDVEVWNSNTVNGQFKYYTDAATNLDALATIGGAADTQYDVTNPSGSTFRYTFDGTGTDPTITATDPSIGSTICMSAFATANNGCFVVTSAGTNYFEIYNPSGSAENNKTAVTIVSGTNTTGSIGITEGSNYTVIKISENGALRVDATATVTVTKD